MRSSDRHFKTEYKKTNEMPVSVQDNPDQEWPGPYISVGETALLTVTDVNQIGAFLDIGLPKELLLPYAEQKRKVKKGDRVLVTMYIDKSGREAVTMNVYPHLRTNSAYRKGQTVTGIAYDTSRNFGVFVAVRGKSTLYADDGHPMTLWYSGLIPAREVPENIKIGDEVTARVSEVKPDGKLTLSVRKKAYLQMNKDADKVEEIIRKKYHGVLPFDDKADPETIKEVFGISKAAFKRAVGALYKKERISIEPGAIRLL